MFTKSTRFIAALVVIIGIAGNTPVGHADRSASSQSGVQNLGLPYTSQTINIPPLVLPSASSLGVQFVHIATAANIYASYTTIIDNPLTNGNPNAIILVTPNDNPGNTGGINDPHPIGVMYSSGKWSIFNQDSAAMPVGTAFNVIIPTAGAGIFVQKTTSAGTSTNIDNALADSHPNAMILVTPNYNPGAVCPCVSANFHIGVEYSGTKWAIFTQDNSLMPLNAAFNVFVLSAGAGVFVHTATVANTANVYSTYIDNSLTNGNPNAIIFVTQNWNPNGIISGTNDDHPIGVFYNGTKWEIYNQDLVTMPVDAAFNVLVLVPVSDIFVHTATAGNIHFNHTNIDNALTNGNPNAIVFATSNWNPGGVGGTGDNHNIGVQYEGQWEIFNQDGLNMPSGPAFNVLVPNPDASVFVHKATAANILSHSTVIDYPLTNGNSNAIIFVTPNLDPGWVGGVYDNHPIGVFYDGSNWRIFNQDSAAMPVDAAFNVFVPRAGVGVFVHTATLSNSILGYTYIDSLLTNGNPNAKLIVTPNWNPGGVGGTNDNHPIGVFYNTVDHVWAIFNQDSGIMPNGAAFNVYVSPYFADVPLDYWANSFIERLYNAGITGGCSINPLMYCPDTVVTRAQMAVFLLRGMHGSAYTPPAVGSSTGFTDVPINHWAAAWIKQLAAEGITGGCGVGIYCPETPVTRDQMAVFLLRAEHGSPYSPPAATGVFTDVPTGYWAAAWIEQLSVEGITGGCGVGIYCPATPVTRAQMAVFLVRTFNLP